MSEKKGSKQPRYSFKKVPVLAALSDEEAVATLVATRDEGARELWESRDIRYASYKKPPGSSRSEVVAKVVRDFHTNYDIAQHVIGYLPLNPDRQKPTPLKPARGGAPDETLKGKRIRITLDRLWVQKYPGGGRHQILIHFTALHKEGDKEEPLSFNHAVEADNGGEATSQNIPIFKGLVAPPDTGALFRCQTVRTSNPEDQQFLKCLKDKVVRTGLTIASSVLPVLAPFCKVAEGIWDSITERRHENPCVQLIDMGLDFGTTAMGYRLREGTYVAVQAKDWDPKDWEYDPKRGEIVRRSGKDRISYNHLIFSIQQTSEHTGGEHPQG